jgi:hypothetical protein
MTNKIINPKMDNKGGTYIELTFAILVIAMLLAIVVDFFPVFVKIKALNEYASYTARMIALEGGINDKVIDGMNLYKTTEGLSTATEDFSECEFYRDKEIQLNSLVSVKVNDEYSVNIIGVPFSVPISASALSRSEVYHK